MDKQEERSVAHTQVRLVASTSAAMEYHYQPVTLSTHAISTKVYEKAEAIPSTDARK